MNIETRFRFVLVVSVATLGLLAGSAVLADIPQSEHDALMALYTSTDGANWTDHASWGGDLGTEAGWYGVTVAPVGDPAEDHVTELNLPGNNLVGPLPSGDSPVLGDLTQLQYIDLSRNALTGSIPADLSALPNLWGLYLGGNQFSGPIPDLSALTSLQYLDLSSNAFTGHIPTWLNSTDLPALQELYLSNNQLDGTIPSGLGTLSGLTRLYLSYNHLSGPIPSLAGLTELVELFLGGNKLSGPIPSFIAGLTQLQTLTLEGNMLSGSVPDLTPLGQLISYDSGTGLYGLDLRWNALHSTDAALITFLNGKQYLNDWQSTQTVAPTGVTAGTPSVGSVPISWTPIVYTGDAGGYRVRYGTSSGGPYTPFPTTTIGPTGKTASSLTVDGLAPSTTYYFVVETETEPHPSSPPYQNQNTVVSEPSAEASATTLCAPPGAPNLVSATPTCSGVDLRWTAGTGTTAVYTIYRATSCGGAFVPIYGPTSASTYSDTDLVEGVTHAYKIRGACDAGGTSESSDSNCLAAARLVAPLPTITGAATNTCPSMTVALATESGMSAYQWYLGGVAIGSANASTCAASSSGNYSVAYTAANGCSGLSADHAVTINLCPPGEAAPGTSPSTAQSWSGKQAMNWPTTPLAATYNLYRGVKADLPRLLTGATNSCTRYQGATASATGLSDDPSLEAGRFYWYVVTAANAAGEGPAGSGRIVNSTGVCSP